LNTDTTFDNFKPADITQAIQVLNIEANCYGAIDCIYGSSGAYAISQYPFTEDNVYDFNKDGLKNPEDKDAIAAYFSHAPDPELDLSIIEKWNIVYQLLNIQSDLQDVVALVKDNVNILNDDIDNFEADLVDLDGRIVSLKEGSAGDLVKAVQALLAKDCGDGRCKFVQDNYKAVNAALCGTVMTSLLNIGILTFCASVAVFICTFMLILMTKRLGKWNQAVHVGADVEVAAIS
jgi:hypothetical protein